MTVTTDAPGDSFRAQMLFGTGPLFLARAASRKTHGSAGTFDVNLPIAGNPGVECRTTGGNHTLVFFFTNNVLSGSAMVTGGTGSVTGMPTYSDNTMTVQLTGVADAQTLTVTLTNVTDEFGDPAFGVPVRAIRFVFENGQRRAQTAASATTDDLGG